jgi:hypothetical protein
VKAKRYKIEIFESALDLSHGFGQTIDEISVGELFINKYGVWTNYNNRMKNATNIKDIEFDDILYNSLKHFIKLRESLDKEIARIVDSKGDVKFSNTTPISCYDDFEKKYLPLNRKERLKRELEESETPEQCGKRLAEEVLGKIKKDLDKPIKHKKTKA